MRHLNSSTLITLSSSAMIHRFLDDHPDAPLLVTGRLRTAIVQHAAWYGYGRRVPGYMLAIGYGHHFGYLNYSLSYLDPRYT